MEICFTIDECSRLLNKYYDGLLIKSGAQITIQNPTGEPAPYKLFKNGMVIEPGDYCMTFNLDGCGTTPDTVTVDDILNIVPYTSCCCG